MSELIQKHDNRATIRWKLLTGASALALAAYVSSGNLAHAEDTDHPLLWIELGGQMEQVQGNASQFTAPFMLDTPEPDSYSKDIFSRNQKPARFAFGLDGSLTFQPEDSDWKFSAGIRYGRSHTKPHSHEQGAQHYGKKYYDSYYAHYYHSYGPKGTRPLYAAAFADAKMSYRESHMILDFSAGKDVGIGTMGRLGSSTINAGVRFAQFSSHSGVNISARPSVTSVLVQSGFVFSFPFPAFNQYMQTGHTERKFRGVGPSLSWEASSVIAGNEEESELTFDWGLNAALLFGRQSAKTAHSTQAHHLTATYSNHKIYNPLYPQRAYHSTRSKRVTVPNVGGFAGLSLKWTNAKLSLGYRYDTFLNAMDTGIDAAKKSNITFNGPYASISFGLGN